MWVEISKDIFETADYQGLSYIFQILNWYPKSLPRYKLFINTEEIKNTNNYNKFKESIPDFDSIIDQQFNEFVQSTSNGEQCKYKITNLKGNFFFNIEESIRYFSQPISIILENNKNDAYFIKAIFNHIDQNKVLQEYVNNGWIKFENAGGCLNVKNFIEGELNSYEDLASRNGRDLHDYYRVFILLDSDLEFCTQPQKPNYKQLIDYLTDINLTSNNFHILSKRMMENYMPDEVYKDLKIEYQSQSSKQILVKWINAYLLLSDEQKNFLNVKDGFSKEKDEMGNRKPLKPEIIALYSNIVGENYDIIDKGFKYPDFKNSFSELFEKSERINKQSLQQRANSPELEDIIQKIKNLI
ncbi:hypothetical protein OZ668_09095 [Elizabethkingia sp. HX XZB]|uniref:hypothetical protein n=1 Tax=Elizabethkingia sp. HX XZB TaxID=3003193 RepID=UPI002A24338F|nr:hypothetical protein [Elizabethkingia sp. HX XZB]MDX8568140.1 hypothetical protein [Elizabethkingia sp. HX XZB]